MSLQRRLGAVLYRTDGRVAQIYRTFVLARPLIRAMGEALAPTLQESRMVTSPAGSSR
jgi:hypothetical protein